METVVKGGPAALLVLLELLLPGSNREWGCEAGDLEHPSLRHSETHVDGLNEFRQNSHTVLEIGTLFTPDSCIYWKEDASRCTLGTLPWTT